LGIACNGRKKQGDEWVDDPCFVDCTVFGKQADFCRDYLRKSNRVLIEARLQLDRWQDRNTNENRSKLKLVAHRVQSLESSPQQPQPDLPQPPQHAPSPPPFPNNGGYSGGHAR
jgi:single stranded DNA-binding protein